MSISRYILPFLLVIISGLMYVLYIDQTYQDILALRAKKADYETAINNAEKVRDLQAKLLSEMEAIDERDQGRLKKLLPQSYDPVLVLYDLNTFAQKRGISLRSPTVVIPPLDAKVDAQTTVTEVLVKFSVSAPYAIFRSFIADIERELALRDIRSLRISGAENEGPVLESSVFTYQVEIAGYAYKGKENPPRPSSVTQ